MQKEKAKMEVSMGFQPVVQETIHADNMADAVQQKQKELRRKIMHRNNIFFNRQIMIEKDFIDKAHKTGMRDNLLDDDSRVDV